MSGGLGSVRLDWPELSAAVLRALQENRERLNAADRADQDHGEQMLARWRSIDTAVRAHPDLTPPDWFEVLVRALADQPQNDDLQAYRAVFERLRAAWQAGELDEERLAAVAHRLVHGDPYQKAGSERLAAALGGLVRTPGGAGRARRWGERFGVRDLLDGALDLAGGQSGALLPAGCAFLVGRSELAEKPHLAESGRVILQALLLEIDRQASPPPAQAREP